MPCTNNNHKNKHKKTQDYTIDLPDPSTLKIIKSIPQLYECLAVKQKNIYRWGDSKTFPIFMVSTNKMKSKSWKFIHRTAAIRLANPTADAITLRCNHSTSHLKIHGARRKALKSRQQTNFIDLEPGTMHQRQYFGKFRIFKIFTSCKTVVW